MTSFLVQPLPEASERALGAQQGEPTTYEGSLLLATVGFEARSRFIAERLLPICRATVPVGFETQQVLSYKANKRFFEDNGLPVTEPPEDAFGDWLWEVLQRLPTVADVPLIVDISSSTRSRLAILISYLARLERDLTVDFLYSPGAFQKPPEADKEGPLAVAEPVHPDFAGWFGRPELPLGLIVGLGYEAGRASAGIELLEPAGIWAFAPCGISAADGSPSAYDEAVMVANELVLQRRDVRTILYEVADPYRLFTELFGLVSALEETARPTLLPMGPKVFALCSLLVARSVVTDVPVWRLSAGPYASPRQVHPSGTVVGLRVAFARS